jgi:hypothetical protein
MRSKDSSKLLLTLLREKKAMYNQKATQIIVNLFISALNGRLCQKASRFLGSHNRPFLVGRNT